MFAVKVDLDCAALSVGSRQTKRASSTYAAAGMSSFLEAGPNGSVFCSLCRVTFRDRDRYDSHLVPGGPCRDKLQRKRYQRSSSERWLCLGREGTDIDIGGGDGEDFGADVEAPARSRQRLAGTAAAENMGT